MARKQAQGTDPEAGAAPLPAADAASIGALLRQAREATGLSLDQVYERTKVRAGILSAIEADNHAALPALTYTLGFVKAFARTVGIDPEIAADRYRAESMKGEPVPTMVDLEPLEARRLPSRGLVVAVTAIVALLIGLLTVWGLGWFTPAPPPPPPDSIATRPDTLAADTAPPPAPTAAPAADAPVRLTANSEVWLRITDGPAGETLFMGTMAKGQTLDLPPGRPWQLRTGRAGALDISVGGQPVPPLGGPAEQVRGVLLTPDALTGRAATAGLPDAATPPSGPTPGLPGALPPADSSPVNPATPNAAPVSPTSQGQP